MFNEVKGFVLLFMAVVMVGTIYIMFNDDDKNAYSDDLYTKEVHNEIMAVEQHTNTPEDIDGLVEEKMLTEEDYGSGLKTVTMVE
ncbi:hypothetical protein [Lacicoccus alkaliphilus]|uniref:Uncharacterized protein n=1 Tax=Lacicoccus alkaliphilus DSM 16010 TaxID=1123231 RepID=A0A1M7BYQ1_9BACL|nr:hypothetical protein [Salinicoccus alkaliphilus]SHL60162.1 hypothetical protein SAMN02745189_00636 [Salinicoccus alkaliphilus DSM 16010]